MLIGMIIMTTKFTEHTEKRLKNSVSFVSSVVILNTKNQYLLTIEKIGQYQNGINFTSNPGRVPGQAIYAQQTRLNDW